MNENRFAPATILIKNTILNFGGMLLPILIGVIAIPFAVKGLGTEAFGILSIAWVILGYLALLDFGLSRATTKFTSENLKKNNIQAIPSIMWTAVIISFCFGCLGAVIFYLLTSELVIFLLNIPLAYINETRQSFYLLAYALPFLLISISLKGMLGAAQRFDLVNLVYIPVSILNFIFPALSLPFGLSLSRVILFIIISRVIATLFYFYLCFKIFPFCLQRPYIDFAILKKLLSYGGWVTVTGVVSPILVYIDRFFIGSMLSMESLTFYAAPLEAITRLRILPLAIMITIFPEFSKGLDNEAQDRIVMLFGKSVKIILMTTGFLSLILFCYGRDILHLWLGPSFAEKSTVIFRIFSISILINFLALIPFTFLQGIGRPELPAKFHLLEFPLYIVLLWLLTKNFGIRGAAFAWLSRVTLDFTLLFIGSYKFLPDLFKTFRTNNIWRVLLVLILFGLFLIPINFIFIDLFIRIIFLLILVIISMWLIWHFVLDFHEKELIRKNAYIKKIII